jgi:hypothetical protein
LQAVLLEFRAAAEASDNRKEENRRAFPNILAVFGSRRKKVKGWVLGCIR